MINGWANTICNGCNRKQNLIEMLRIKKTKNTYKIICPYCGSDNIRPLTDKVNEWLSFLSSYFVNIATFKRKTMESVGYGSAKSVTKSRLESLQIFINR